jgi:hypothetical protein
VNSRLRFWVARRRDENGVARPNVEVNLEAAGYEARAPQHRETQQECQNGKNSGLLIGMQHGKSMSR